MASGVTCLEDLRGLAEKHSEKVEALAEFLRSDVGIVHYRHAEAIASFAMELEASSPASEDETFSDEAPPQQLTLSLEGNIGVGKSTFLDAMASGVDRFEVVQEPVDQWRGMGEGEGSNLLEAFYSNPSRYAYTFQNYVLLSRVQQAASQQQRSRGVSTSARMARRAMAPPELLRSAPSTADWSDAVPPVLSGFGGGDPQQIIQPLNSGRIMERSIFSDRIVFAQHRDDAGHHSAECTDWLRTSRCHRCDLHFGGNVKSIGCRPRADQAQVYHRPSHCVGDGNGWRQ